MVVSYIFLCACYYVCATRSCILSRGWMQNRKPQLLCFCLCMLCMLLSLSELIPVVAFVASTDCHKASLCGIFWLIIVTSNTAIVYMKYILFLCASLYICQLWFLSDTQLSNLVRRFHEDKISAGVLALYRVCLGVGVFFLKWFHNYCILESPGEKKNLLGSILPHPFLGSLSYFLTSVLNN